MRVAVITDSTACIPAGEATQWHIRVVDVQLRLGDRVDDERRFARETIIDTLRAGGHVSTSPPEEGAFFWAYQDAVAAGADAIVSVHISAKMSATGEAARQAAQQINIPVYVLDSATTGMSLGFAALSAARTAEAGGDPQRVVNTAQRRLAHSHELIYVDTLEYLRRGGRIGGAAAMLGTALSVKPLLTVTDGEVAPVARVAGTKRALAKMVDLAVRQAGDDPVEVAISAASTDSRQLELRTALEQRIPDARRIVDVSASTVIGAHVGPNALGITIAK